MSIGSNQSFLYCMYSWNLLSWKLYFSFVARIYLHIVLSILLLHYYKQCVRLGTYLNILLFQISWGTMSIVTIHASISYLILYHHHHCSLSLPFLIFQTLRFEFLPSLILYLLVCLQLKVFSLYPPLLSGTRPFTNQKF